MTRRHRGPHPRDRELFAPRWLPVLRTAVADLSLLLGRGYRPEPALKLVGDRFQLARRQRLAVLRCACGDVARSARLARRRPVGALAGCDVAVDGLNCLITLETALSGGPIFIGRDGCCRDLASIHGTYRLVSETPRAVDLAGAALAAVREARWYLDRPVSNSGRLRALLEERAAGAGWPWRVALDFNPDRVLAAGPAVAASSDEWIIDKAPAWCDLAGDIIAAALPDAWRVDLGQAAGAMAAGGS